MRTPHFRCLTRRVGAVLAVGVLGACALVGAPATAATAATAATTTAAPAGPLLTERVSKQVSYTCQIAGVPGEATVGFLVTADVPASVTAGEQLSLSGNVTLRFPENVRAAAVAAELTEVEGYSDTVTFPVTVGGQKSVLLANRVQVARTSVGNPLTVSTTVTIPTFTVPAGSSGEVVVELPENDTVDSPRADLDPSRVAFTAIATLYGDAGSQQIGLFCYDAAGVDRVIARIPIVAAGGATSNNNGAATANPSAAATGSASPTAAASATEQGTTAPYANVSSASDDDSDGMAIEVTRSTLIAAAIAAVAVTLLWAVLAMLRRRG